MQRLQVNFHIVETGLVSCYDHNKVFQFKFYKTYFQNRNINMSVQTRDKDYGNENYDEAATPNAASDQPRSFFPFLARLFFTWQSYK